MTKKRREELEELIRKVLPHWNGKITGRRSLPRARASRGADVVALSQVIETPCCGVVQIEGLHNLEMPFDVSGNLADLVRARRALFELWLHAPWGDYDACHDDDWDDDDIDVAAIIATTAVDCGRGFSSIELFIKGLGFRPVSRGENPNTGNDVTVWIFTPAPDKLQALTPPAKETSHVASARPASPRAR